MSDFADIANELGGAKSAPTGSFADIANSLNPPKPKKPDGPQRYQFQTNDPAELRRRLAANSDPSVLAEFDRQFPEYAPKAPAQLPSSRQGAAAIPVGQNPDGSPIYADQRPAAAPTTQAPETWWDKVKGIGEAALSTATGLTGGALGYAGGAAGGIAGAIASGKYGTQEGANLAEQAANEGAAKLTYAPRTQAGQRYAQAVGKAVSDSGIAGVAPLAEFQALPQATAPAVRAISDAAGSTMDAAQQAFQGKGGAPARIEPTFQKPRYVMVNGEWQIKNPEVPGGHPDVAAAVKPSLTTASPELQQAATMAQKKGPVNPDVLQRHVEADSLPVKVQLTAGQAALDPVQISAEQNNRGKFPDLANILNEQGKKLAQNINVIKETAAPDAAAANHVEAGQTLVDLYKSMDAPVKADISAKYKALFDAAGGDIPLNGDGLVKSIDAALSKQMKGRYLPSAVRGDLEDIRGGSPLTFENFENLRTNLAAEARKAQRSGDGNALGAINIARSQVEALPMEGEAAGLKPLADAARSAAKARFDKIKADPAYAAAVADDAKPGDLSPLADSFIQQYVIKGKTANVAKMSQNLAGEPLARQVAAAGAIDYLKNKAGADVNTGLFSQSGYNNAWKELSPKQAFLFDPQTGQNLETLGNVARYTQVQPRGAFVNNSNTLVGHLASKAATVAEKTANVAIPGLGLGTDIRSALAARAAKKAVESHTAPGAGLTRISDFPK